jgi:mycofactocin precursor
MEKLASAPAPQAAAPAADAALEEDGLTLIEEDLLVEDVSIDGMCGVY